MARVRKRRRAQARFRLAGLCAVLFALAALAMLLFTIGRNASLALTAHSLRIGVEAPVSRRDARDESLVRAADFDRLITEGLKAIFPQITGRSESRALRRLVSSSASVDLRARALEDPVFAASGGVVDVLLDDLIDLYLKGALFPVTREAGRGSLVVTGVNGDGTVTLRAEHAAFAGALALHRRNLARRARILASRAGLQERGARVRAREIGDENARAQADRYLALAQELRARQAELEEAAAREGGFEPLGADAGTDTLSLIVRFAERYYQVRTLGESEIRAAPLLGDPEGQPPFLDERTEDWSLVLVERAAPLRKISDFHIALVDRLERNGHIIENANWRFLGASDSREAERAGIFGAILGSAFTMLITMALAVPIGALTAVYMEKFAPRNRLTAFIDLNINNLAAVPSIVFGLVGLTVIIGLFGLPRSTPLVGGIVLALMSLPTIVIASRAAIVAVPPSIYEAALGIGASHTQAVFHHVFPLALPGMLTGSIIAMAQALGETAPLILIGMVAFIVDPPSGVADPAAPLPVLIYRWSDLPEQAFQARAAAAIAGLLLLMIAMNALAVFLRNRFEKQW